jgi:2-methylcitrate dehydratase PrpD
MWGTIFTFLFTTDAGQALTTTVVGGVLGWLGLKKKNSDRWKKIDAVKADAFAAIEGVAAATGIVGPAKFAEYKKLVDDAMAHLKEGKLTPKEWGRVHAWVDMKAKALKSSKPK